MSQIAHVDGIAYQVGPGQGVDISIPLRFNGPQPNAFGVEHATAAACEYGSLVGDTRRGGSCNFETVTLIPHCNGTHTECVGHITDERISIRECLQNVLMTAELVSVEPERRDNGDLVIADQAVSRAFAAGTAECLIIRTLPNGDEKLTRAYRNEPMPPYFSADAVRAMVRSGVKHLLVDLPSIDRLDDGGHLENHRIFWQVGSGARKVDDRTRIHSTITEMIYVPPRVPDGSYLLNLQIAPFEMDAAPSRPILFPPV
jgi:arylformamidase